MSLKDEIHDQPAVLSRVLQSQADPIRRIAAELEAGRGPGHDFLGWLDLPARVDADELAAYERQAILQHCVRRFEERFDGLAELRQTDLRALWSEVEEPAPR